MNKTTLRVILLVACALLLAYSLLLEKHQILSYDDQNSSRESGGADYVKSVESGVLLRSKGSDKKGEDSGVYDAKTLIPEAAQIDDCPT